ncbi:uncharacterized protein LOC133192508 [Saccostrea echinata]|uniref:uncharacterized protein LOC133192508 n=1 Tax=Saccostrea echinata TaxID=191078 RepID=UPI002A7FE29D|nr:uncharacterized protein LOC133192508 [Saccostrea echinata]
MYDWTGNGVRDPCITCQVLYRLSYPGRYPRIMFCMRKNKVGILSDEEEAAYKKIEKVNNEDVEEEVHTPSILDAMFCVTPNEGPGNTKSTDEPRSDDTRSEVIKKSELVLPTFKSSVPKLLPINGNIMRILILPIDDEVAYQKWKEETHKVLQENGLLKEDKLAERRRKLIERGKLKN